MASESRGSGGRISEVCKAEEKDFLDRIYRILQDQFCPARMAGQKVINCCAMKKHPLLRWIDQADST